MITLQQLNAISTEQLLAFTQEQLAQMTPVVNAAVVARLEATEPPPANTSSVDQYMSTNARADNNVVTETVGEQTPSGGVTTPSTRPPRSSTISYRPPPGRPDSSFDPFDYASQIDDMLNSVPNTITAENVNQVAGVLSLIPAAEIASRLSPSAVCIHTLCRIVLTIPFILLQHSNTYIIRKYLIVILIITICTTEGDKVVKK